MARTRRHLTLPFLILGAALVGDRPHLPARAHAPLSPWQDARAGADINGPFLVLDARGGIGQPGPGEAHILVVQGGRVIRALAREQSYPFTAGFAPAPRGRDVAYAENTPLAPGNRPQHQGLWVVSATGGISRRVVFPPVSTQGNRLDIGAVAWSSDRYTLAYTVVPVGSGVANPEQDRPLGIWLTRYDQGRPRELITNVQLGADPSSVSQLAWEPDGRTLIVSTFVAVRGTTVRGTTVPTVLAVDAQTGSVRTLVNGGQDADASPTNGDLVYTTSTAQRTTLWVADARGGHPHALAHGSPASSVSPVWSPDGRTIAFIDTAGKSLNVRHSTAIRTVDVATGRIRTLLRTNQAGQPLLPVGSQFVRLAWLHTSM